MTISRCWMLVGLLAVLLTTAPAWAGHVYTVGGDTGKSLADGLAQLHTGDTLSILPGTYHESITVPCDDVTIEGAAPGVILDGSVSLTEKDFTPAADRPGVYTWALPAGAEEHLPWIFYQGKPISSVKNALNPAKDAWCCHVDYQGRRLEVVFDGKGFPEGATLVVPTEHCQILAWDHQGVTIRGLEVYRAAGCGIAGGIANTIEDNLVEWTGAQGIVGREKTVIRRNTIRQTNGPGLITYGNEMVIEENLIVANGSTYGVNGDIALWDYTNTKMNAISYCTFQQNWILDRFHGGLQQIAGHVAMYDGKPIIRNNPYMSTVGLWPDTSCYNNTFIDNAVARQSGAGIYIEAGCNRSVVLENDVQDCAGGITLRTSSQGEVTRNWVWDRECLGWGTVDKEGFAGWDNWGYDAKGNPTTTLSFDPAKAGSTVYGRGMLDGLCLWQTALAPENDWCDSETRDNLVARNLVQVSGDTVSIPMYSQRYWPTDQQRAETTSETVLSNQFTGNFYTLPAKSQSFALLGTQSKSFADYRKLTGWDGDARVGHYTPAVLGLEALWTIPGLALDNQTPVSILYDPSLEAQSALSSGEPLFWHGNADRDGNDAPYTRYEKDQKVAHSGRSFLSVANVPTPLPMDRPLGWYSSAIPVKPGITMAVSLWMAADKLQPAKDGTGARVTLRFTDATGHPVSEAAIVGDGHYPALLSGSYTWTNVGGQAVVPAHAYWMTVYLGDDPSTGTVRFDDIYINMRNPVPPQFPWVK
jgi:hypothetical protein